MARTVLNVLQNVFGSQAKTVADITPYDPGVIALAALRSTAAVPITPLSEALQLQGLIPDPLKTADTGGDFFSTTLPGLLSIAVSAVNPFAALAVKAANTIAASANKPVVMTPISLPPIGGRMAFSDGIDSGFSFSDLFSGVNQALQGGLGQTLLNVGSQYAISQFAPQPASYPMIGGGMTATPVMAAVPAIGRGIAVVGRSFFNKFPNLATAIQALRNRGANVTRSKLYSLLKRFGPDFLVTGGILTAAAVSELAMAGPGRRRMNAGNVKALRRAHRRMKAFHHVCRSNDLLLGGRKRSSKSKGAFGTTITQVR